MVRSPAGRLLVAAVGALAARQALRALTGPAATRVDLGVVAPQKGQNRELFTRTNYRGRTVSLAGGPALAVGASAAAALGAGSLPGAAAAFVAGLGSGAVGGYDDVVGARPEQKTAKGFRGHLAALAEGRVTSGLVKIVGVGLSGLAAATLLKIDTTSGKWWPNGRPETTTSRKLWRSWGEVALGAGVIAGTANLVNLLDLRPGRALKAGLLIGAPVALGGGTAGGMAAGAVGAAAGLLPADLDEQIMLGDAGANALGALLGTALAARTGPAGRAALLAGIVALTAASEKVSFTQVIQRTPVLRELDELGRRAD